MPSLPILLSLPRIIGSGSANAEENFKKIKGMSTPNTAEKEETRPSGPTPQVQEAQEVSGGVGCAFESAF